MGDFDWKQMLGGIAPTIATALGGPFAGGAVKFLAGKLLGDENADEAELAMAMQTASPETLAQIRQIDADYKVKMRELGIEESKLAYEDTKNARDMAKNTTLVPQIVLSAVFITGYFAILILMGLYPEFKVDPMTFGIITVSIPVIMQFWFGSSHGSKSKKETK